jgi:hypothetical protein
MEAGHCHQWTRHISSRADSQVKVSKSLKLARFAKNDSHFNTNASFHEPKEKIQAARAYANLQGYGKKTSCGLAGLFRARKEANNSFTCGVTGCDLPSRETETLFRVN